MDARCAHCGAALPPAAAWCTLCYRPVLEAASGGAAVTAGHPAQAAGSSAVTTDPAQPRAALAGSHRRRRGGEVGERSGHAHGGVAGVLAAPAWVSAGSATVVSAPEPPATALPATALSATALPATVLPATVLQAGVPAGTPAGASAPESVAAAAVPAGRVAALPTAASPTWPCGSCRHRVSMELPLCDRCGTPFLATGTARPTLALPGVGDVLALSRGQRWLLAGVAAGAASAVLVALMAGVGSLLH